ncbi:MAG TPA: RidA family protein [Burkholderiales bacterium]|nr:RidA family protein [Burkholderiales bacterium]
MTTSNGRHAPQGRYSLIRAVPMGAGRMVYVSGLTSGPDAPFDVRAQTQIIFRRMAELLATEGGGLQHLVKITAYLVDMREYGTYNEVRNEAFAAVATPPVSASVGVSELVRPEARIEIEGVAYIEP